MRWRRLTRNRLSFGALCVILAVTLTSLLAPWVAPYDPDNPDAEATLVSAIPSAPTSTAATSCRASSTPAGSISWSR
jgi:ABC-type antimicrobial peptide transport system permease subunit